MNPVTRDKTQRWAGETLRDAIPDTGEAAETFGRTARTVRRWRDGNHPSFLTESLDDIRRLHESGGDIWRVVSHYRSYAKWLTLRAKPTHELVERWASLTELEHELEAAENRAIQAGDCATAEILADEREAAIQEERAAVRRELEERRVNPRHFQPSTNGRNR